MKKNRNGWKNKLFLLAMACGMCVSVSGKDANDELGRQTDMEFNDSKEAVFVNGVFVKSLIGIDIDGTKATSVKKEECKSPLKINGVSYDRTCSITCPKTPNFVTLADIQKKYCPQVKGKVVFMINKFFITRDTESYKLDKDYILKCESLPSTELANLVGASEPFTIIRVFTKTEANTYPVRIR